MVPIDLPPRIKHLAPALRQALLIWFGLVASLLVVFRDTAWDLLTIWSNSATYGHGFLIVPIVGYLIWRRRYRLPLNAVRPEPLGILLIGGAGAVWLAGHLVSVSVLQHFALVGMIQASVLTVFGWRFTQAIAFPLIYLLLAVPFGEFAVAPLQDLTAVYTVELLRLTGIPVYLENWRFVIPGGAFLVAEACAGLRYVVACFALGFLICDLLLARWWKWVLFISLSLLVPIVANVIRAYGIVMLAYMTDFQIAAGADHLIYGGIFLSFVTLILILLGLSLRDRELGGPLPAQVRAGSQGPQSLKAQRGRVLESLLIAGLAAAIALASHSYGRWATSPPSPSTVSLTPADTLGAWQRQVQARTVWTGTFPGADAKDTWRYARGRDHVDLFVAHYRYERPGAELVSAANRFAADESTRIEGRGRVTGRDLGHLPRPSYLLLDSGAGDGRRIVWYWYKVGDVLTHSGAFAKFHGFKAKLLGGATSATAIAISTPYDDESAQRLSNFASQLRPSDLMATQMRNP